ncbi:MAG: VWA domain-containing protein [Bryobacteraceae bacterium]|jgi:VWFA-related protein
MTRRFTAGLMLGLGIVTAQNAPFRVQTKVVQVPVSVIGKNGRNVDGLVARDFKVLEDGVRREITADAFSALSAPISLVVAIQSSGISSPALLEIRKIGGMIQPLVIGRRGEAAVVTFDSEIKWLQDFTSDDAKIRYAVKSVKTGSRMQARMLDAIAEASDRLKPRTGRKVLLLISESRDRGSKTSLQQTMEVVGREGIEVFGAPYSAYATTWVAKPEDVPAASGGNILTIFSELVRMGQANAVEALTEVTGGSDYPFLKERGIENAVERFGADVHSQYILSFPQSGSDDKMHSIDVSVLDRTGLHLRYRRAYWAGQAAGAQ